MPNVITKNNEFLRVTTNGLVWETIDYTECKSILQEADWFDTEETAAIVEYLNQSVTVQAVPDHLPVLARKAPVFRPQV